MIIRFASLGSVLAFLGLLLWLAAGTSDTPRAEPAPAPGSEDAAPGRAAEGSALPCAVPLAWRVARLDDEFGLRVEDARAAAAAAAALWEDAAGRRLFVFDSVDGLPIRFLYDEGQARTQARRRAEADLEASGRRLDARRAVLDERRADLARDRVRHGERGRSLEDRLARHNAAVRRWNDADGAPAHVFAELRDAERSIRDEQHELEERARELDARSRRLQDEAERLGRELGDHRRRLEDAEQRFRPTPVESGVYREAVFHDADGRVVSVSREIRVFRFDDRDDLVRVLAHEFGHALGLGHDRVPGSIMNERYGRQGPAPAGAAGGVAIQPTDVASLRARCPEL